MKKLSCSLLFTLLIFGTFGLIVRGELEAAHFEGVKPTSTKVDFIGYITIDEQPAASGDEVGVFDDQGLLVGSVEITTEGQYGVLHVYGDDTTTPAHDGASPNSILTFKVWQKSSQKEIAIFEEMLSTGTLAGYIQSDIPPLWTVENSTYLLNITASTFPIAKAGPDQEVEEGDTVTLDASDSIDPDDGITSYLWTQLTEIPATLVTISDPNDITCTFVASQVDPDESLTLNFRVTVWDQGGHSSIDEVSILIHDNGITDLEGEVTSNGITTKSSTGKSIGFIVQELSEGGEAKDITGNMTRLHVIDPNTIIDTLNRPQNLIYGLVDLQIRIDTPGHTAIVTVYLPEPAPSGYTWYKYSQTKGWYDYSQYAKFNSQRNQITLTLSDGGAGDDDDGPANGVINDPSGLGVTILPEQGSEGSGGCFIEGINPLTPFSQFMLQLK